MAIHSLEGRRTTRGLWPQYLIWGTNIAHNSIWRSPIDIESLKLAISLLSPTAAFQGRTDAKPTERGRNDARNRVLQISGYDSSGGGGTDLLGSIVAVGNLGCACWE